MTAPLRLSLPHLLVVTGLCLVSTGCFPVISTVRPHARFLVEDAERRPIDGAILTFGTRHMPLGPQLQEYRTDAAGEVSLSARHRLEWQLALPDTIIWYSFSYCVEKPGYRAVAAPEPNLSEPQVITMERTQTRSVCSWTGDGERNNFVHVIEQ